MHGLSTLGCLIYWISFEIMNFCNAINSCAHVVDDQPIMELAHRRRSSERKTNREPLSSIITMEESNYFLLEYMLMLNYRQCIIGKY